MSEYKKGKYSFSLAPALVLVGKEIVEERKNQVEKFIRELEDYDVILRDLAEEEVSFDLRNDLLNIAMYISETAEIYNEFYEKKELPINKISKGVLKSRQFLQKWRDYIIVYSLILGDYNYKYIWLNYDGYAVPQEVFNLFFRATTLKMYQIFFENVGFSDFPNDECVDKLKEVRSYYEQCKSLFRKSVLSKKTAPCLRIPNSLKYMLESERNFYELFL